MKNPKVLIGFHKYSDSELSTYAQSIVTAMTGNPDFTTPNPSLTDLSAAITAFNDAMNDAYTGDHASVELKNQKRELLSITLYRLGTYVHLTCAGDAAKMRRSGFKISKEPAPIGPLPKPTGLRAISQGKGEMKVTLDKVQGANNYQYEYKEATATDWTIVAFSRTRLLLTGLQSGKEYFFRVLPIGTSEVREYSDEVSSFVL